MKIQTWVKPFIKEQLKNSFTDEYPEDIVDKLKDSFLYLGVARLFKIHDITKGFLQERHLRIIGEVLCRLPEEVFKKLYKDKIQFIVPPFYGAGAIKMNKDLKVIFLPLVSLSRKKYVLIGEIAHEFAHIYAGHLEIETDKLTEQHEREADQIASDWGFQREIRALNKGIADTQNHMLGITQ